MFCWFDLFQSINDNNDEADDKGSKMVPFVQKGIFTSNVKLNQTLLCFSTSAESNIFKLYVQ